MSEIDIAMSADLDGIVSNSFGEHYLFGVNRNLFQGTDASTVFRSYFGDSLFEEDSFYVIAGTDSGLLYQYIKANGVAKGSRYLFLESPQVLELLDEMGDPEAGIFVSSDEDWLTLAQDMKIQKYAYMGRLCLLRSLGVVHGHYSGYPSFWRGIKEVYDAYIKNVLVVLNLRPFMACQLINLTENQVPATCLINTFKGKTAVLLAGGPSLDELLPWVKQHRKDLLVIAVSRISASLLTADIKPDIVVSVDPLAFNFYVCKEMLEFEEDTLLVNNYHLSPNLLASWGGKKAFAGSRYPWNTPKQPNCLPESVGTTVTNTALDLAVKTGVAQVILGGADFCFNQQGYTHATGTAEQKMGSMPHRVELQVETNGGMMADTVIGYVDSANAIDAQAKQAVNEGCKIINPSPGSMRLKHVEYIPKDEILIEPMESPAVEIINKNVPVLDSNERIQLYKEELGEVDRMMKEVREIKLLAKKGLSYNDKVRIKKDSGAPQNNSSIHHTNARKVNRIDEQLNTKYAETVHLLKGYNLIRLTSILRLDLGELDDDIENNRIYFQALIDTSRDFLEILGEARTRILSRLEEEKPEPNIQRLSKQWKKDQQPGRALLWAKQHEALVNKLPSEQRAELDYFKGAYNESLKELYEEYLQSMENDSNLEGTAGRAREFFICNDQHGILRLLSTLEKHNDPEQSSKYIPLLKGYSAELDNDQDTAIQAYREVTDGPHNIDALMRLFAIYTKEQNWTSAIEVLNKLSNISPVYTPMYADLLYANGDVDGAIDTYTEYLLNNPDDLTSMMKLGNIYQECGSIDGVEWVMNYILSKDPDNHTAKKMLNDISADRDRETMQS